MAFLSLRVLGALGAAVDGREVPLGGAVPRALLARLAVAHGDVVPDDVLIDDLWRGDPPPSARVTVQGYVATLRKSMEPGRRASEVDILLRKGIGYALARDHHRLDADDFVELARTGRKQLDAGDVAGAVESIATALSLWSGPAYADVTAWDFAAADADRLDGIRLDAVEDRLMALSATGDQSTVVTEARVHVDRWPLRERGWEVLALAQYRAGRQGDALAALDRARRVLADELGVDPGPALARLHEAVLAQDPALDVTSSVPQGIAVRGSAAPIANIPSPLTALVGRDDDVAEVAALVDDNRLVTVVGPGGMGKTRLALAVAAARRDADGPWWVPLADVRAPEGILDVLRATMGLTVSGGIDDVCAAIGTRRTLLVADNCEHLVDAVAAVVESILMACPRVDVLATSREALGVGGECVHELGPLAEAEDLFTRRAGRWAADADPADVAALCDAVDRMPLAVELAAAQSRSLSVRQIREMLDDRIELLRGGSRTVARHESVRAAIDGSFAGLTDDERALFADLSVFDGGFDLAAATAVTGRADVVAGVTALVSKSLVTVVGGDPRRYRLLQPIRAYARDALDPTRGEQIGDRHVAWVRELAARAYHVLRGPDSARQTRSLSAEMPNVRAALSRSTRDTPARHSLDHLAIAGDVHWFWFRSGHVAEGMRMLVPALEAGADIDVVVRIRAVAGLVVMSYLGSELETLFAALTRLRELLVESTSAGEDDVIDDERLLQARADAAETVGFFLAGAGAVDDGRVLATRALAISQRIGATATVAEALMSLGMADFRAGDHACAAARFTEALAVAREVGYDWCAASTLWLHVKSDIEQGVLDAAPARRLVEMVDHCDRAEDVTSWMVAVFTLAYLVFRRGDAEGAGQLLGVVERFTDATGFSPEAMDVVELARYGREMRDGIDPVVFATAAERGRDLSRADVRGRFDAAVG
ncbi:BTAD domain-containing putative transcriptional regulator [uncultured Williamsia sp.]|uniref:BTAD domain-containing putative transcriptional regulator n=1 Tax=uncultured Williamsia sp. TaxID=259311 RepID=UPI002631C1AC|nr:BTAD domain-containing putative transcriptional regulator [uncultured Williamsia sp.]